MSKKFDLIDSVSCYPAASNRFHLHQRFHVDQGFSSIVLATFTAPQPSCIAARRVTTHACSSVMSAGSQRSRLWYASSKGDSFFLATGSIV